ncbi:MAG: alpha/beta fold hydrolase [Anaerolineales bacterium]
MTTKTITAGEALGLWLTVPRKPISKSERAALAAARNYTINFEGESWPGGVFELPVSEWSDASKPLVLLMHGWGGHRGQLVGFAAPLVAAGFRAVAFDAPAHGDVPGTQTSGYQMAEAMHAVLEQTGMPQAIVAHSLGTMAVGVAMQKWLKPGKVVFSGPMRRLEDTLEPFLKMSGLPLEIADELRRVAEKRFGQQVWEETSLDLQMPKMDIPALIFHDREDEVTPWVSGAALARTWPSAQLVTTHGLGHRGGLKNPEVIKQVVEFIAS